jgi:hypothetical protein
MIKCLWWFKWEWLPWAIWIVAPEFRELFGKGWKVGPCRIRRYDCIGGRGCVFGGFKGLQLFPVLFLVYGSLSVLNCCSNALPVREIPSLLWKRVAIPTTFLTSLFNFANVFFSVTWTYDKCQSTIKRPETEGKAGLESTSLSLWFLPLRLKDHRTR